MVQWEVLFTLQLNVFVILVSVTCINTKVKMRTNQDDFQVSKYHLLRLMVPELLLGFALDLRHDELDILGNQLALLPGHWLACIGPRPHLGGRGIFVSEFSKQLALQC